MKPAQNRMKQIETDTYQNEKAETALNPIKTNNNETD